MSNATKGEAGSKQFDLLERMNLSEHEMVVFCRDRETGLNGIIGVHNTVLGPAMGGLRMYPYNNESQALDDVLRLSRAMTYKSSLAGINVGGGKAVIIGDPKKDKSEALLRRFGQFVDSLGGKFYAAADVGIKPADLDTIKLETPYVSGVSPLRGGSGDSAPLTAYGVYLGMKAAILHMEGQDKLQGKRVMVQGVGKVGSKLVKHLIDEEAEVYIYDTDLETAKSLEREFQVKRVENEQVLTLDVDILAPCALGGILNEHSIPNLKCRAVVGGANNQLLVEDRDSLALQDRGILFVPDFMVNAGGIVNVSLELQTYHPEVAKRITENIYDTTLKVLELSEKEKMSPLDAAKNLAEKRLREIGKIRLYR
ncbi:MAG: leucine dehydrogenase [Bacteroidia bacterium]|nr:leucine dehydrogenase [Bacteroidia bacterium]